MTKTVYKYPLKIVERQFVDLPVAAKILSVQMQGQDLCLWALIDKEQPYKSKIEICIFGTGFPIEEEDVSGRKYYGTFQAGFYVGHVFA